MKRFRLFAVIAACLLIVLGAVTVFAEETNSVQAENAEEVKPVTFSDVSEEASYKDAIYEFTRFAPYLTKEELKFIKSHIENRYKS